MKLYKGLMLSFVAPLMILISIIGLKYKEDSQKIFYLPLGLTGVYIILKKNVSRKLKRQQILKKIKSYKKDK